MKNDGSTGAGFSGPDLPAPGNGAGSELRKKLEKKRDELRKQLNDQLASCERSPLGCGFPNGPIYSGGPFYTTSPYVDYYVAGYEYQINWNQVDWFHVTTNLAGMIADGATVLAAVGIVPAAPVAEVATVIDGVGVVSDVMDFLANNDVSGVSWDIALHVAEQTKAAKLVPLIGFGLNAEGFSDALYRGAIATPIWKKRPSIGPSQ